MKAYGRVEDCLKSFLASRYDKGECRSLIFCFTPCKGPPMNNDSEFGWTPKPVWILWSWRKWLPLPENEPCFPGGLSRGLVATLTQLSPFLFICLWCIACSESGPPNFRSLTIKHRQSTVGRSPQEEWTAWRRKLDSTIHNNHERQTSMPQRDSNP
jgi:hypothetical protein